MPTWCIVGATRGIGFEFVRQLLARGDQVIAAFRTPSTANQLWQLSASQPVIGACELIQCDVTNEASIQAFANRVAMYPTRTIDYIVLNASVLRYPNRATEISYRDFEFHLRTNAIGPIITAQKLLATGATIKTIVFISSDLGSALNFRDSEDGFGAYASSKAALNQMLRHMAAELKRKNSPTIILAMHPGEVATDTANIPVEWEVEGIITPQESVEGMLRVIPEKGLDDSGTFWTWEGNVHPW